MAEKSLHPHENDEPRALAGSDPEAVREIVEMQLAIQKMYNEEFLEKADAPLVHYREDSDLYFYDLFSPGEYSGDDVRKFYNWIGPTYVGKLELKEIKVFAKGEAGFVVMKQHYYGKDTEGNPFHWIMRQTDGVVKVDGVWKIAHSHISFPVDEHKLTADLMSVPVPLPWDREKK